MINIIFTIKIAFVINIDNLELNGVHPQGDGWNCAHEGAGDKK